MRSWMALGLAITLGGGCTATVGGAVAPTGPDASPSASSPATDASSPPDDAPEASPTAVPYPAGPYGFTVGATFPPGTFELVGQGGSSRRVDARDYYDPDGARGVTGLHVTVCGAWCQPCRAEARLLGGASGLYEAKYRALGARILTLVYEDEAYEPATIGTARAWATRFELTFDVGLPSAEALAAFHSLPPGTAAIPLGVTVDPRTMKVRALHAGASERTLVALDKVVAASTGKTRSAPIGAGVCGVVSGKCEAFDPATLPAPGAACSSADVQAFVAACVAAGSTPDRCTTWGLESAGCKACVSAWLDPGGAPNARACALHAAGGADPARKRVCQGAIACMGRCFDDACSATICASGGGAPDERAACYGSTAVDAACGSDTLDAAPVGATAASCTSDPAFRAATERCRFTSTAPFEAQLEAFLRGACVYGGDFSAGDGG